LRRALARRRAVKPAAADALAKRLRGGVTSRRIVLRGVAVDLDPWPAVRTAFDRPLARGIRLGASKEPKAREAQRARLGAEPRVLLARPL